MSLQWCDDMRARSACSRHIGKNAKHAFFGARDVVTRRWFWTDPPCKLAVHFGAFLDQIVAAYPSGRLYIAMDGAPAHTALAVERLALAHPRVTLLRRPAYATALVTLHSEYGSRQSSVSCRCEMGLFPSGGGLR